MISKNKILVRSKFTFYFLLAFATIAPFNLKAKDIYVDLENGSDSNTGSLESPFQSIQTAINNTTDDWDQIFISPGVYRETVKISGKSKIKLSQMADTEGDVIINGTNIYPADLWSEVQDKEGQFKLALKASAVETQYTQVFCDGNLQQIARYPNNTTGEMLNPTSAATGYTKIYDAIKYEGENSTVRFSSDFEDLPSSFSDEFVFRGLIGKLRNNIFSAGSEGDVLTKKSRYQINMKSNREDNVWSKSAAYEGKEGFGYIMDYSVLDYAGEWFHRKKEGYLYYQATGGTLSGKDIEVKLREYSFDINSSHNIEITGIHTKAAAVRAKSSSNINFSECSFQYMRPFRTFTGYGAPLLYGGIDFEATSNSKIQDCYIAHTWTSGIVIDKNSNDNIIHNCIIEDIGWVGLFTSGVYLNGGSTTITQNTFGRASRFHIRITSRQTMKITDNEFHSALAMGEDTGVIHAPGFTSSDPDFRGSEIAYNVIHDIYPMAAFDSKPGYKAAKMAAFYMEELGNYSMHHNIVYNLGTAEKQKSSMGNYEAIVEGKIFFFPTQARDMSSGLHVAFYNNTCWNYNLLYTSWMEHEDGKYGKYEISWKNNIFMETALSGGNEAQISLKRTDNGKNTKYKYDKLAPLVAELNKAPWSSKCSESSNTYLMRSKTANFKGSNDDGNFEPLKSLVDGVHLPGYTKDDGEIEQGAYEGTTEEQKTRVAKAGAMIDPSLFPGYTNPQNPSNIISHKAKAATQLKVYPNPASDVINIKGISNTEKHTIYDACGRIILTETYQKSINISNLKEGVYIIRSSNGETDRFIKE